MFDAIHGAFSTAKYYFAPSEADDERYPFEELNQDMLRDVVKAYHGSQQYYIDIMQRSREVLKAEFDEKMCQSYAKVKCLIILTEHPLSKDELESLTDVREEEVDIVNFVFDSKSVSKKGDAKMIFTFEDVQTFIKTLKNGKLKTAIC